MSGGVDSSVAAALLKQEKHEVIGATMQILPSDMQEPHTETDAKKVADKLGIPHYVMDLRDIFARQVITDFCQEYRRGRTPNPCIRCNRYIKFGALLERAREMGADFIVTGHHARIELNEATGTYLLKKGVDPQKDQSYFLCQLTQEQLSHTLFPIGNFTKDRVRQIASELNLPVASRPESQEICFIPDDDYQAFL
jgi:tRNA-specific 2-thiouridylase